MLRKALIIALLLGLSIGAGWMADHPGELTLRWLGYEIRTSASFLFIMVLLAAAALWLSFSLLRSLLRLPVEYQQSRQLLLHQKGLEAITEAFIALSDQNHALAQKHISRAEKLLPAPTLPQLMRLQLTRLKGDEQALQQQFQQLEQSPQTKPLALTGMLQDSRRNGRMDEALRHAEALVALKPKQRSAQRALVSLYSYHRRWQEALKAIASARRHAALTSREATHLNAVVYLEQAQCMLAEHNHLSAAEMLRKALSYNLSLTPAVEALAGLYLTQSNEAQAVKLLRRAWKLEPHPTLYTLYLRCYPALTADKQLKKTIELAKQNPQHIESRIALAQAFMEAREFTPAREQLNAALHKEKTVRLCKLMAELEQKDRPDSPSATEWLKDAASATPNPGWVCTACHHEPKQWTAHCSECHDFDTIRWKARQYAFIGDNAQ